MELQERIQDLHRRLRSDGNRTDLRRDIKQLIVARLETSNEPLSYGLKENISLAIGSLRHQSPVERAEATKLQLWRALMRCESTFASRAGNDRDDAPHEIVDALTRQMLLDAARQI